MIFSYDAYKRLDRPYVYLAKPNKDYIGTIQARELNTATCFNDISTATFKVNKYEDGEETLHYDDIALLKLIEVTYMGWFQITEINQKGDGNNEYIEVVALSLENEATSKLLTSFGQLGVETDEQGGLDRYCLHDIADTSHSILHIWQQKMPAWSIGYVDPKITKEYRTFTDDEVSAYTFLTSTVSETFECIFQFDSFAQTVSAYKLENIGKMTSIYLSYDNLIKSTALSSNFKDIKTVFTVAGGDDNGTPLGIIEVNPTGNNQITNFSYYKKDMSEALRNKLDLYEVEYNNRLEGFTNATDVLKELYDELGQLKTKIPSDVNSTNWTLYGLDELNTKYNYYNERMSVYIGKTDSTSLANYSSNFVLREAVNAQLTIRKAEVSAKELAIENQRLLCESLTLNLRDYLGENLYKELSRFYHEDTFTDDTFVVTESMTDAEALEMKRELLKMAQDKLAQVCKPSYTLEVDAINFTAIPEFQKYTEQLELGNIITLDFGDGILVESRLLKMNINWDNLDDFSLTFSSKNRLDGFYSEFAEIVSQSSSASTSQHLNGTGWNNAKNKTSTFDEYMNETLDLANQKLKSSENEEFTADSTGTKWKKWLSDQNKYSPNQMWGTGNGLFLTQNSWQSVSMAIGEGLYNGATVYGVWGEILCGNILLSKNLHVINANSSIIMNENGATFKDCDITINKGTSTLKLNASDGIKLTNNGVTQFYIDGSGNAIFSGKLSAASGTFTGSMTAGSININNRFIVDSNGNLTANNVTLNSGSFSGSISASSISGSTITGSSFSAQNGNYNMVLNSAGLNFTNMSNSGDQLIINSLNIGWKRSDSSLSTILLPGVVSTPELQAQGIKIVGTTNFVISNPSNASVKINDDVILTSGNYRTYSPSTSNIVGDLTDDKNIRFSGGYNAASVTYVQTYFARTSHSHDSTSIYGIPTGAGNITLQGSLNAASVTYVQDTFVRKDSSDFRLKYNIVSMNDEFLSIYNGFKPKMYKFKDNLFSDKKCSGLLAQEIITNFGINGLDWREYDLIEEYKTRDYLSEGMYTGDTAYRVKYENLHAYHIAFGQFLYSEIDKLRKEVLELKQNNV